jgi:uncharacterized protein YndB with AHSA1/START domain
MSKTIKHTVNYTYPPAEVWAYLTKPELIEQWLMKTDFQPVTGFDFTFTTKPLPQFNFDGIAYCKVLEVAPNERLSYTWKGGPGNGEITLDSVVEWTLEETAEGSRLTVEHSGFEQTAEIMFEAMNQGWLRNMQKIETLISEKNGTAHA